MRTKQQLMNLRKMMHPAALLLLAACLPLLNACRTDDLPGMDSDDNPPAPEELVGQPVNFGGLTVTEVTTDASTRAVTRTPVAYTELGATMTITMTVNDKRQCADYTYRAATTGEEGVGIPAGWQADDADSVLCWQDVTTQHSFVAYCPRLNAEEKKAFKSGSLTARSITLPDSFTAENYMLYDYLSTGSVLSKATKAGLSFTGMKHLMTRVEVTVNGSGRSPRSLQQMNVRSRGTQSLGSDNQREESITMDDTDKAFHTYVNLWRKGNAYYGYMLPQQLYNQNDAILCSPDQNKVYSVQSSGGLTSAAAQTLQLTITCNDIAETTINADEFSSLPIDCDSVVRVTGTLSEALFTALATAVTDGKITDIDLSDAVLATSEFPACFKGNTNLKYIYLPRQTSTGGTYSIADYAFQNCTGLLFADIPDAVAIVGEYAFSKCSNLLLNSLPSSLTSIGTYAFDEVSITKLVIPASLTKMKAHAFAHITCPDLIIEANMNDWGDGVFADAKMLLKVRIIGNSTTVNTDTFVAIQVGMLDIEFPASITSLRQGVFYLSYALHSMAIDGNKDIALGRSVFTGQNATLFLYGIQTEAEAKSWKTKLSNVTWRTIYYGYTGGDKLDVRNYSAAI